MRRKRCGGFGRHAAFVFCANLSWIRAEANQTPVSRSKGFGSPARRLAVLSPSARGFAEPFLIQGFHGSVLNQLEQDLVDLFVSWTV